MSTATTSNGGSNSSCSNSSTSSPSSTPNLTSRPEFPPVLKRSKTVSDETRAPHFPGPLFPAVRRVSTSPPSLNNRTTSASSFSSVSDHAFNLADRDYVYPSFLGPYATRSRVAAKSAAHKSNGTGNERQAMGQFSARMPSNLTVDVGNRLDSVRSIAALPPPPRPAKLKSDSSKPKPMAKLKGEKDLNPLSAHVPVTAASLSSSTTSTSSPYSPRKPPGHTRSWILNLVSLSPVLVY